MKLNLKNGRSIKKTLTFSGIKIIILVYLYFLTSLFSVFASDPKGLATNNFDNNGSSKVPVIAYGPGKKERQSKEYRKENPDSAKRDYYEYGGQSSNHDCQLRAFIAYKAARYSGPKNGYNSEMSLSPNEEHKDGPRPKKGGGNYDLKMPTQPEKIISNIYRFVEDITYPKFQPSSFENDTTICALIRKGTIDIGNPWQKGSFMCIETNLFFTSLVRELGFPAMEKNVLPSFVEGEYDCQTAASNVWYNGQWHFFDAWESFRDTKDYLTGTGHAGYVTPESYHDVDIWIRESAPDPTWSDEDRKTDYKFEFTGKTDAEGWKKIKTHQKNAASITTETHVLRLSVTDTSGNETGGISGIPIVEIPNSCYLPHDKLIQYTHEEEPQQDTYGVEIIALFYEDYEPLGTYDYELSVFNPSNKSVYSEVIIENMEAIVEISVNPEIIDVELNPNEMKTYEFQVHIGSPLLLPPEPVSEVDIYSLGDTLHTLYWLPVNGAVEYIVYASPILFESPTERGVHVLGRTSMTNFSVNVKNELILGVEAVGPTGLTSGFDYEGSSTVVTSIAGYFSPIYEFAVVGYKNYVEVFWTTTSETNIIGFYIYRSDSQEGVFDKINEDLISGKGERDIGAKYNYFDTGVQTGSTYYYLLESVNDKDSVTTYGPISVTLSETNVPERKSDLKPKDFALGQNFPNPFNQKTTISFDVKERTHVVLKIYDIMGREKLTLVDSEYDQGSYKVTFNASRFSTGLYFYRIQMGSYHATKKMVLLK